MIRSPRLGGALALLAFVSAPAFADDSTDNTVPLGTIINTATRTPLIADQEGVYVFVVEDGKAVMKRVKTGDPSGTGIVIESGLAGGELVIVEGLQSIRPGAPVRATPVTPAG